ncbi:MAG: hypothetical protein U0325_00665 [Polyangiales bacterium]
MRFNVRSVMMWVGGVLGMAGVAFAQTQWVAYTSQDYGITMLVPDIEHCTTSEEGSVGHLACRYPEGLSVDVYGSAEAIGLAELRREAAARAPGVPQSAWQWRAIHDGQNGYRLAETWSAHGGGRTVIGLIGQSARRTMSHVVFVSGSDAALQRHQASVRLFINSIHAL